MKAYNKVRQYFKDFVIQNKSLESHTHHFFFNDVCWETDAPVPMTATMLRMAALYGGLLRPTHKMAIGTLEHMIWELGPKSHSATVSEAFIEVMSVVLSMLGMPDRSELVPAHVDSVCRVDVLPVLSPAEFDLRCFRQMVYEAAQPDVRADFFVHDAWEGQIVLRTKTVLFQPKKYTERTRAIVSALEKKGYTKFRIDRAADVYFKGMASIEKILPITSPHDEDE